MTTLRTVTLGTVGGLAALLGLGLVLQASAADTKAADARATAWKQPKTPWGEPDLRGIWPILSSTPLQRPKQLGDKASLTDEEYKKVLDAANGRADAFAAEESKNKLGMGHWAENGLPTRQTSLIVDPANGQLPGYTDQGKAESDKMRSSWRDRAGQEFDWVTDFDSWDRCITRGMPASMFPFHYNNGMRIFQAPGVVALNLEMIHETRVVPTDGRPAVPSRILQYMGESRGHWEGNTLVVETTNLHPGPSMVNVGTIGAPPFDNEPVGPGSKIVEKFTLAGPDELDYEMTFSDPALYTASWTAKEQIARDQNYGMYEYACHEGNEIVPNYIHSSRAKRAAAAAAGAPAATLAPKGAGK
jgi:hypothetical protein